MPKKTIYKDRFFLEDEQFDHPEFFSAVIRDEPEGTWLSKFRSMPWCQVDIGTSVDKGMSWGFCLEDQHDVREAIYKFLAYRDALDRVVQALSKYLDLD
jgi:galactose mutarotase-like enzyme